MLLRTRLILLVTASLGLLFGGFVAAGSYLERLHDERLGEIAIGGEAALWQQLVAMERTALDEHLQTLSADPALLAALAAADPARLRDAAAPVATELLARHGLSDFQVLDRGGGLLFAVATGAEPQRILDAGTIDAVLAGAAPGGLRQVSSDRFVVAAAVALKAGGVPIGVLTLAVPAIRLVTRFAAANDAESFLVSLRGRMIHGTDEGLWDRAGLTIPARRGSVSRARIDEAAYTVTGVPIPDMSSGSAGILVTARHASEALRTADRISLLTIAGALMLGLLTLGGLYVTLRRAFTPLDQAIAVLEAMARGDTGVTLSAHGDDEIGRIAEAVRAYRRDAMAIAEERRHRELQRRRQERFIRRQMETLADALATDARQQVLADLQRMVAPSSTDPADPAAPDPHAPGRPAEDEQLGLLAAVMRQLSARVVQQHEHLRELIERLREALIRETKLAGLEQELAIARHIQTSILPVDYLDTPAYGLFGLTRPAREVGGDFYDFFPLDEHRLGILVADVSGKGVPAAFFMAISRTLLRALAPGFDDPARCLGKLNETLAGSNPEQLFVTVFYGIFDARTGTFRYANGGHNPPLLIRPGTVEVLPSVTGIPLGIFDAYDFAETAVTLAPGDTLVLYTDGVTEAMNPAEAFYGMDRWQAELDRLRDYPPDRLTAAVMAALEAFAGPAEQADDITCLALQVRHLAE